MRYELNERQWRALAPLLPQQGRGGAWKDHRAILNGILWRLHTEAPGATCSHARPLANRL